MSVQPDPGSGQEVVFECDLFAERATYGAPVSIELEQYRRDGSRIAEYAVEPRWLTIELAEGQLVQLVREAELADETEGNVVATDMAELRGARGMHFRGGGHLAFHLKERTKGTFALWLRARWKPESSTAMTLVLNDGKVRHLRATAMIGFTDWTNPRCAHTKMFAHFGEQIRMRHQTTTRSVREAKASPHRRLCVVLGLSHAGKAPGH